MNRFLISITALLLVIGVFWQSDLAVGSAGSLPALPQTATSTTVGPDYSETIFNTNDVCSTRVISTTDHEIMLAFFDPTNGDIASTSLSATVGHIQPASTTKEYDAEKYGCKDVSAFATASTTITITELD